LLIRKIVSALSLEDCSVGSEEKQAIELAWRPTASVGVGLCYVEMMNECWL
jgi:hypothetical protein